MPETSIAAGNSLTAPLERLEQLRAQFADIRARVGKLFHGGASGPQVCSAMSEAVDEFIVGLIDETLAGCDRAVGPLLERQAAVIAVGGSGRGEMAPHSDVDLLFLYRPPVEQSFTACAAQVVRDCWDSGIKLGHSIRTLHDARSMARADTQFATSLIEARLLWGDRQLFDKLQRRFHRTVVRRRRRIFIEECIAAREQERLQHGYTVQRLEPDVKRSLGGLRDLHLIRWVGFARFGTSDIDTLRRQGALSRDDARALQEAYEFLSRIRVDLHLTTGKAHDILSREEQLRIAGEWGVAGTEGLRPVECFMQSYFQHSTAIANIAQRFVARQRFRSLGARVKRFLTSHRADGIFQVDARTIDLLPKYRQALRGSPERILKLYWSIGLTGANPAPELVDLIKQSMAELSGKPSPDEESAAATRASVETSASPAGETERRGQVSAECVRLFLEILSRHDELGRVLRSMYDTGLLEFLLPEMTHARCLLQFNQYHSYTVDEHTLRAVEEAANLAQDQGPIGTAYRAVHRKEILHLALLLHDLGKGYQEDHSEVGRRIAEQVAERFGLPDSQRDALVLLVHKHLLMSHLAFRRDLDDPDVLLRFSRDVGSPETLRMLYVLTAADISAVGPGVFTGWKAELLSELYDRAMLILSGKRNRFQEQERLHRVKQQVRAAVNHTSDGGEVPAAQHDWIDKQLDAFPPHYLMAATPVQIAGDLETIQRLQPGEMMVKGRYDGDEVGTVEYRIILDEELSSGCFHKITGVLAARRLEILSAQICTSLDGTVVDSFRVLDNDFAGQAPQSRIDEIAASLRDVLTGQTSVEALFKRYQRFASRTPPAPTSDLPTRVVLDNDSSDRFTVIDVFAHDRPGLLYHISRAIYRLDLSINLAKIATHFDQIVDVFYVTDMHGRKINDQTRLTAIRDELQAQVEAFEHA
jgi:[protein-PII] uridylyltransferase